MDELNSVSGKSEDSIVSFGSFADTNGEVGKKPIFFGKLVKQQSPKFMNSIHNNTHRHRFELETDGKLSIVEYQKVDGETLALVHTEVEPSLEGHGIGSKLVEGVLEYIEQHDLKIVPLCPFVSAYLKRHPDWNRVVSTSYTATGF